MSNSRNPNIVPTFLQPNTVRSSRAAIFDDDFDQHQHQPKPKRSNRPKSSRRHQDQDSQEEEDSEDGDDQQSRSILERLYGQLQGAIEIEGTATTADHADMTTLTSRAGSKQGLDDDSDKSEIDDEEQQQQGDEGEDEGMEFRLFASDDTPTTIVLTAKEPEIIYVHRERPPLEESPGSERMRQIAEAAIDTKTVLEQSNIPWARSFFLHKVIHIPFKQETGSKKVKKSKRKREWEKKVKAGLIDQATINATARKTKVSESWGEPYIQRHGLDRNTIDPGTLQPKEDYSSRGGRGGGRGAGRGGARGGRGGGRGRGRGGVAGSTGPNREGYAEKADWHSDKSKEASTDRPAKKEPAANSVVKKTQREKVKHTSDSTSATTTKTTTDAKTASPPKKRTVDSEPSTKTESSTTKSTTVAAPRPPKKPKANKPMTKLDNIMAILTGK
ncbi:hypothetical protein BGZ96_001222 [Linnemannia gamsii]|uniref:Uncharacterized protein n=1 Tax=Linnemannia gamsii TaxID=64522 RepID=A0ABQ7KIW2_9FUNG|nr:hypothetical protein BGZ96_001222 [Linnemannia gamsii]